MAKKPEFIYGEATIKPVYNHARGSQPLTSGKYSLIVDFGEGHEKEEVPEVDGNYIDAFNFLGTMNCELIDIHRKEVNGGYEFRIIIKMPL